MNEVIAAFQEIKKEMQGLKKALAKFSKTHAQNLTEEWNRPKEAMKILGISSRTFSRMTNSGQLPFSKINGLRYIKTSDIEKLLNENYHNQN